MSNSYQEDKKARIEAMKTIKVKQSQTVPTKTQEKLAYTPQTPKEKWENYWYHYKYHTIVSAFLIITVVTITVSILAKKKPDISMLIVSENNFKGSEKIVSDGLEKILVDYNNDGEILSEIIPIQIEGENTTGISAQELQINHSKMIAIMTKGDNFLYLVDDTSYKQLTEMGVVFKDLSGLSTSKRVNKDKYDLTDSNFCKELKLDNVFDNMYLCLADFDRYDKKFKNKKKNINQFNYEKDLFIKITELD